MHQVEHLVNLEHRQLEPHQVLAEEEEALMMDPQAVLEQDPLQHIMVAVAVAVEQTGLVLAEEQAEADTKE